MLRKSLLKREKSYLSNWLKTMAFKIDESKKIISDWHFICTCNTTSSIRLLWSKIIYMYKVFLSLLTHLFESSSLARYIPYWRQTFLTARENFYKKKHCYEIIPNFRYTVIPWKVSEAESILMSYDLTLLLLHSTTFSAHQHHPLPNQKKNKFSPN